MISRQGVMSTSRGPTTWIVLGSRLSSSLVSRTAAASGLASSGSRNPPGKQTSPGWRRRVWARTSKRRCHSPFRCKSGKRTAVRAYRSHPSRRRSRLARASRKPSTREPGTEGPFRPASTSGRCILPALATGGRGRTPPDRYHKLLERSPGSWLSHARGLAPGPAGPGSGGGRGWSRGHHPDGPGLEGEEEILALAAPQLPRVRGHQGPQPATVEAGLHQHRVAQVLGIDQAGWNPDPLAAIVEGGGIHQPDPLGPDHQVDP